MDAGRAVAKVRKAALGLAERHKARRSATGHDFALADGVGQLSAAAWDAVTAGSTRFLDRRYLDVVERTGPANLRPRYALVMRGREPVAAIAAQLVDVHLGDVLTGAVADAPPEGGLLACALSTVKRVGAAALQGVTARALVCGNLLSWGPHGVAFARGEDPAALWPAVAEALYRLRRADRLTGQTDVAMVKDFPSGERDPAAAALRRYSYHPLETDPDMVLEIPPAWRRFEDYAASLNTKYRKAVREAAKEVEAASLRVIALTPEALSRRRDEVHALYLETHRGARVRPVTLGADYLPALADAAGPDLRVAGISRGESGPLVGFSTTLRDGETAVGYYMGFSRAANDEAPVYLRLLHAVVADAISLGCRRLSLGRTALEPKARLGARPAPLTILLRHRLPHVNLLVRHLLCAVHREEAPERNPFKA